jgi:hypothetical protein
MSGQNWNRPIHRRRGRETESLIGGDVPPAFRSTPSAPQPSKAALRQQADLAFKQFTERKAAEPRDTGRANSAPLVGPRWEHE